MSPRVVVVGGGPAGLAAAIVFAKHAIPTVLCEHRTFAVDKACGEGILPSGVRALERLGLARAELEALGHPFAGVRYVLPQGGAEATFAEGVGLGIRRTALSACLHAHALRLPALRFVNGAARARPREAGGWNVAIDGEIFSPRLLVAADGLHSMLRKQAALGLPDRSPRRWGARLHFRARPWSPYVEVHFSKAVEAYVTPVASDSVGVAFLWDGDAVRPPGGADLTPALLARFPLLSARLAGAAPCSRPRAAGPFHHAVRSPIAEGLVLVGDAAGYLDALTGEGVGLSIQQALLLEEHVVPLLRDGGSTSLHRRELVAYARAADRASRSHRRVTALALALIRRPRVFERVLAVLAKNPALFRHLLSANMGEASLFIPALRRSGAPAPPSPRVPRRPGHALLAR